MSLKTKISWKIYNFIDEIVSEYQYGCRVSSSEKARLYPKEEE